jgi:hypothetical protein
MSPTTQKAFAWCGVAFPLLAFPAMAMMGLIPPFAPSRTAEQVAAFWSTNTGLKRFGIVLYLASAGLQVPFSALIAARVRQLEGRLTPLTCVQVIAAAAALMSIILPAFVLPAASYRPARDPQDTGTQ